MIVQYFEMIYKIAIKILKNCKKEIFLECYLAIFFVSPQKNEFIMIIISLH